MLNVAVSLSMIVVVTAVVPATCTSLPVVEPGVEIETVKSSSLSTNKSSIASSRKIRLSIGLPVPV